MLLFKKILLLLTSTISLFLFSIGNRRTPVRVEKRPFGRIKIRPSDRILILSPHPDDAALSSSGLIQESLNAGAKVKVVYITYGSHSSDTIIKSPTLLLPLPVAAVVKQGRVRHDEAVNAMKTLGLNDSNLIFLGFPDSGTLKMWDDYFNNKSLFSGVLANDKIFYKTAYKRGIKFNAVNEFSLLKEIILKYKPTKIIYPSIEDLNPDHRATGLFLLAVLSDVQNASYHPERYAYFVHAVDWPSTNNLNFSVPGFIYNLKGIWFEQRLDEIFKSKKEEAILCHKIPVKARPKFLLSFVKDNEIFLEQEPYKKDQPLILWSPKELNKLSLFSCVSSVFVTEDDDYLIFNITVKPKVPSFSKIYVFVYPLGNESFLKLPKYRVEIVHGVGKLLVAKLIDGRNGESTNLKSDVDANVTRTKVIVKINKRFFNNSQYLLSSVQIEKLNVRVSETPWWFIDLRG